MNDFTVNMMTAAFVPGDAIGNYLLTSSRLWRKWGTRVALFADHIAPAYGSIAKRSTFYLHTGHDILWFHFSLYANNVQQMMESKDFRILDFHGITPPHLFIGTDKNLQILCQKGLELLPQLPEMFNFYLVHSEYARQQLLDNGFAPEKIYKLPYCVDNSRLGRASEHTLLQELTQLEYFLFIGRLVPNKDVLSLLDIFAHVQKKRPNSVLVLIGTRSYAIEYQRQIDRRVEQLELNSRVIFTGQISDAALAAFLRHAKLLFVTSDHEAFCVPIIEAMYFGVPPVVHHIAPLPEVAGEAGLVIDKNDPAQAATAVLQLLNDPIRYQNLSQLGRQRILEFTEEALATALLTVLKQEFQIPSLEKMP